MDVSAPNPAGPRPDPSHSTDPQPEWRTLRGVVPPFVVFGTRSPSNSSQAHLCRNRNALTGDPFTIVRVEHRYGRSTGLTSEGLQIDFYGAATKAWIAPATKDADRTPAGR